MNGSTRIEAGGVRTVPDIETLLATLIDFELGFLTYMAAVPVQACEPDVHIFIAEYQDPTALARPLNGGGHVRRIDRTRRQASGAGVTAQEAMWAALGEAVERYSASNWRHLTTVSAPAGAVPGGRAFLDAVILFDERDYARDGFPFRPVKMGAERVWCEGWSLTDGTAAFVPAALAFMDYDARAPDEILDISYSTGLASHTDLQQALLSGLCEVVERDAYVGHWLCRSVPRALAPDEVRRFLPDGFGESCDRAGFAFSVLPLDSDVDVPVFAAISALPGGGIATGAACSLDAGRAITKCAVECAHTFNWCLDLKRGGRAIEDPDQVLSFENHVVWYLDPARAADFPWHPDRLDHSASVPERWLDGRRGSGAADLAARLDTLGFRPLAVDLTSPDLGALGFRVVKCFVPGLQPLSAGYRNVHTDRRRLETYAARTGTPIPEDLAMPPHSFP